MRPSESLSRTWRLDRNVSRSAYSSFWIKTPASSLRLLAPTAALIVIERGHTGAQAVALLRAARGLLMLCNEAFET